jgi:hypothetical protein
MKSKNNILIFLSLIWLITNAADCGGGGNPEPVTCTEENTVKFPQDALDRFYFKEGSYWVYTDSATSTQYDSVWVYHNTWNSTSKKEDGHYKNKCYEFGYSLIKTLSGLHYNQGLLPVFSIDDKLIDYSNEQFRIELSDILSGTASLTRFYFNGNNYDTRFTGEVSFKDSLEVNSTIYNDILKIHYADQHSDFLNDGYWARNIGLIKYTDFNGTVWELTNYNAIQ